MSIILRGEPGYYSREVVCRDVTFRTRELGDEEWGKVESAWDEYEEIIGGKAEIDAALQPDEMQRQLRLLQREQGSKALEAVRNAVDLIVSMGVVGWELDGSPCTPENILRLPPPVKLKLCRAIVADTRLSEDEQAFLTS